MRAKSSRLDHVGDKYGFFRVTKATKIPELQAFLRELIHEPTGAQVMHIANQDPENLFCLSFQTVPENSNGVAHVLEHTVLCGSEKYPIKDPFFAMNRRSLNTFMNALTGADFTCYPAASQVPQDFYNLLEVYLDAVFHPRLTRLSFLQEGHRLEFASPDDPASSLERKGIVYNEMKGALSSSGARLAEAINQALFPDITYGVNSGGDPRSIPALTYEQMKLFYEKFYHRSRCLFFFYGNMPLEPHLDFIETHALAHAKPASPLPPIPLQPRFTEPRASSLTYPIGPDEETVEKSLIAFGWLTCHILEQEEALALTILEIVLLDTDASPLKMALLKSGWCKQVSSFIDVEIQEVPWGIILKGCDPAKADALEALIRDCLRTFAAKGIPLKLVENAMHQLEFHRSEITGDHAPFGLSLFMRAALLKQHGAEAEQGLMIHSLFESVHQHVLSDPLYFPRLIHKWLLDNPHFVKIVMEPDNRQALRELEEEQRLLAELKEKLSIREKQAIVDTAAALAVFQKQQEEEDLDLLPKVMPEDIPLQSKNYPLEMEKFGSLNLFHHGVFTNGIIYADLVFELPKIAREDLPLLRFLSVLLNQIGCGGRNYAENLEYIQGNTGGIGAGISLNLQAHDARLFSPTFHIRGKALQRKASKLFSLIHEVASDAHFDDLERLREILFKHYTQMESRLSQGALKYAINLSASGLNEASLVAHAFYGLDYYFKIKELVQNWDHVGSALQDQLNALYKQVTCLENPHLVLGCEQSVYAELKNHGFYGLKEMRTHPPVSPWDGKYALKPVCPQGRIISSPVAFIGKVLPSIAYAHPFAPALSIAAFLFDNLTLHPKIREQGGAYGGGAVSNPMSGSFYFYSYRDPNVQATFEAFEEAIKRVVDGEFEMEDIEEAKFEMVQSLDSPVSPGSRAEVAYSWIREGKSLDMRQAFREKLLQVTPEDIVTAVSQVIAPYYSEGASVVFAGKELLEKANAEMAEAGAAPLKIQGI